MQMPCFSYRKGARPSVCVSVCHTLTLYQNDASYYHEIFTMRSLGTLDLRSIKLFFKNLKGVTPIEGDKQDRGRDNLRFF